jgi:hypothetical protein
MQSWWTAPPLHTHTHTHWIIKHICHFTYRPSHSHSACPVLFCLHASPLPSCLGRCLIVQEAAMYLAWPDDRCVAVCASALHQSLTATH